MITKTPQQQAICDYITKRDSSLNTMARAGSGKTTTLLMICEVLDGSAFLGAFNKGIAEELKIRLRSIDNMMIEAGTFHSLGFRGWRTAHKGVRVESDKLWNLISEYPGSLKETSGGALRELVSIAKQSLFDGSEAHFEWQDLIDHFGIECNFREEQIIVAAKTIFQQSAERCEKEIDFDDMLWAPLHFDAPLPRYDTMLIDEAQDTNAARRELAIRCLSKGGRIISVGDNRQAIYGFSGADANAMALIAERMKSETLPLTVSWRCARAIIERAQLWVPDIEWAPQAKPGEILHTHEAAIYQGLAKRLDNPRVPKAGDAVLCRNTRPLVELAFFCIRQRIGVTIEGRDIGKRIIKLAEKFKVSELSKLIPRVEAYSKEETERMMQKNKPQAAAQLADLCDTVVFLAESLRDEGKTQTDDLVALLETMFSDAGDRSKPNSILLSTIHKSKGREWEKVFILGENRYQPSRYAKQDWQLEQEYNLMYVATTRAKHTLVHIEVEKEEWE